MPGMCFDVRGLTLPIIHRFPCSVNHFELLEYENLSLADGSAGIKN